MANFTSFWNNNYGDSHFSKKLYTIIERYYSEPTRYYHNFNHIEFMIHRMDQFDVSCYEEVFMATLCHDIIYDTRRIDNEQRSADFAYLAMNALNASELSAQRVVDMILATNHIENPTTGDMKILLDLDLAIFAEEISAVLRYDEAIRKEYLWVNDDIYFQKRVDFLRKLLAKPNIYYTYIGKYSLEAIARDNIKLLIEVNDEKAKKASY